MFYLYFELSLEGTVQRHAISDPYFLLKTYYLGPFGLAKMIYKLFRFCERYEYRLQSSTLTCPHSQRLCEHAILALSKGVTFKFSKYCYWICIMKTHP